MTTTYHHHPHRRVSSKDRVVDCCYYGDIDYNHPHKIGHCAQLPIHFLLHWVGDYLNRNHIEQNLSHSLAVSYSFDELLVASIVEAAVVGFVAVAEPVASPHVSYLMVA